MKPKTAKITIRARGYGKSITLNDAQTDILMWAIECQMDSFEEDIDMDESEGNQFETLKIIRDSIAEGPK